MTTRMVLQNVPFFLLAEMRLCRKIFFLDILYEDSFAGRLFFVMIIADSSSKCKNCARNIMGEAVNPFSNLPDETCEHILDFLDGKTLVAVQQTCRRFRGIVNGDYSYRVSKPLIDRLPYQRRLEAYEELLGKVSKREKAGVEEELQWLENLELIFWEQYYKNKEKRETRKNQMKTLLKGGHIEKSYTEPNLL